jgi:hypothetical protein
MKKQMIIDAYCKVRKIDNTIPDDVLDFMKDCAIEKLNTLDNVSTVFDIVENNKENSRMALFMQFDNDEPVEISTFSGNKFTIELKPDNGFIEFVIKEKKFKMYLNKVKND